MREARFGGGRRGVPVLTFACLGSSGAVPSATRDTTALVVRAGRTTCLIDVGGSPVQKLRRLGVDPVGLAAVVVTHLHPDHVYGLPALVQNLIILGRRAPLPVYCRTEHVQRLRRLLALFDLVGPRRELAVEVAGVEPREQVVVLQTGDLALTASPNVHGPMPNLAVRIDAGAGSLVYSSDTRPCREVARLARDATVLVHEATFARPDPTQWHSTARQAGRVARAARVRRLFLAHIGYALHRIVPRLVADARAAFGGPVRAVRELTWYRV
ncbi:MAG TPA: ribonuclease Z [Methylomirabilota bacterium]|nr:ribonuclease Z [Methylomirabilota bacterium]